MRTYVLTAMTAALVVLPNLAFSQAIDVGPGGIRVEPGCRHHRLYNRSEGRCWELRKSVLAQRGPGRTRDGQLPQISRDVRLIPPGFG